MERPRLDPASSRSRCTSAEIFSIVLCTVSSWCALSPEGIHPRMRLDGGTSRRPARRSMSARSSGERQVATVPDLFGCLNTARRLPAVPADGARVPPRCVYIYAAGGREPSGGAEGRRHASVQSWLRADCAALDLVFHDAVLAWVERDWPFDDVQYASRS